MDKIEYCVHGTVTMQFHHLIKATSEQAAKNDTKIDLENNAVEFSSVFGNLEITHINPLEETAGEIEIN